uniref:Integral membrane protein n=1 Tax=Mycena chlorophos TaxID=658473 RepID=A0ABQ0L7B1_MYCCL|nr:predicted protein [Mycena chlorophos]
MTTTDHPAPSWPSLYNPGVELLNIPHHLPMQPAGKYLVHPKDVFRFTLYWTLVLYTPVFLLCGVYAFMNLTFPPAKTRRGRGRKGKEAAALPMCPLTPRSPYAHPISPRTSAVPNINILPSTPISAALPSPTATNRKHPSNSSSVNTPLLRPVASSLPARHNRVRSRTTFALLVLLAFLTLSVVGAVLSAAIVGFAVAGVYQSAKFAVSTWVPFVWALITTLVGLLSVWPSVIDII